MVPFEPARAVAIYVNASLDSAFVFDAKTTPAMNKYGQKINAWGINLHLPPNDL